MAKAKKQSIDWQNRIVEYGQQAADQFLAHDLNARRHPNAQRDALRGSLNAVGWIAPVIVSQRSGKLLDGHARIEEALSRSESALVPYVLVDVTEAEEAIILGTFDPITNLATYDREVLDTLLREIETNDAGLQNLLEDLAAKNDLYLTGDAGAGGTGEPSDAEPQIDRAAELNKKWKVKTGDLWLIGEHRLLCGDSTKAEDVARVMDGEKAEMMFTDPPYGVNYEGGHFHSGDVNIKRKREELENDHSAAIYADFLPTALSAVDGPCYMWFADSKARDVYNAVHDAKCEVHALIIWHKTNATYAAMNAQYKQRHEPCLYFKPKGSTLRWCGASTEATIWNQERDGINDLHPTQKPIALAMKAIGNHETKTVADFFCGSGSTMVAAENLNRKCYALEISENYCAVILERMATAFPSLDIRRAK